MKLRRHRRIDAATRFFLIDATWSGTAIKSAITASFAAADGVLKPIPLIRHDIVIRTR